MDKNQTPKKQNSPYLRGAVVGAVAGAVAGGLLTVLVLWGLMGSGHGGPLEGTGLEPAAWTLLNSGPVLAERLGLGTDGREFCGVMPYGIISIVWGVSVVAVAMLFRGLGRFLAHKKSDNEQ